MNTRFSLRFCQFGMVIASIAIFLGMVSGAQAQTATLGRTSLNFGTVLIGQTPTFNQPLRNTGTVPLAINSIAVNGPVFSQTNNCGSSLAAGASCTIAITFAPTAPGSTSDVLTLSDNAADSPQSMTLLGSGTPPAYFSAANFAFGSLPINTTSAAQTVTVTNRETTALPIGISISASYAQTNTCGSSIPASGSCTISMTFTPTAVGSQLGTLTVTPSIGPPITANLSGTGTASSTISPTSLAFGNQAINTTSAAKAVTLTNKTTTAMGISGVSAAAPFAQTNTCGTSLAAGASCTFSVTFKPTSTVASTGNLAFTLSNGGAQSVPLTGTGVLAISVTPTSIAFGNQATNTTSPAQTVTIKNLLTTSVSGLTVTTSSGSGFAQTTTCTSTLAAGASCTASVTFTPTSTGNKTGTTTANYSGGSAQTVSLTGAGTAAVAISPTSLTFGSQNVGTTSAAQTITVNNAQSTAMSISSIVASAGFAQTNTCGTALAAKGSCTISVTFAPTVGGALTGTITITDNAAGSPQTVALTGTGAASVTASPTSLAFGPQMVSTTSTAKAITITNSSGARVTITVAVTGNFAQTNTCSGRIRSGSTCSVSVTFTPTAAGALTGTVSVTVSGTTQSIPLTGTGASSALGLTPTSLAFGVVNTGSSSGTQTVSLTNAQTTAAAIGTITLSDPSYKQTNTCGTSLAANSACSISVVFSPTTTGSKPATMTFSAGTSNMSVSLSGTGVGLISVLPASLNFGPVPLNVTTAAANVTVKNNLTVNVGITSIAIAGNFAQTNNCTTLTPGASCVIGITFDPLSVGILSGSLTINDNYAGQAQTVVALSGTGVSDDSLTPGTVPFGNQIVQSLSAAKVLTLTNSQPFPMSITGITMTGDFSQTNTCGTALAAKSSCTISVAFLPLAAGSRMGSIAVAVTPGVNVSSVLGGTGIQPPISALPAALSFSPAVMNTTSSQTLPVTVTNTTTGAFTMQGIATSAGFVQTNNCPATLNGGASCTVNVGFAPTAAGAVTGTLMITDTAAGSPQIVSLSGTAVNQPTSVTVLPSSVSLGLGGTQQFSATATFSSGPSMDVTSSAVWTSGNPSVVSINSTGLATVLATSSSAISITASFGGVNNSASPAWLSALSSLPINCPTPNLDMKLLIITNGKTEAQYPAITQILDYMGTPYTVFDMAANPGGITASFLSDGSCHGYFQGIIFADGGYTYSLTGMPLIVTYEQTFNVRQINWYTFPTPDFGFTAWSNSNTAAGGGTATWAANASVFFPYVNTTNPLVIDPGAWTYFDTAITPASGSGATITPLLTSGNNVVSLIYNTGGQYPREMLTQTFASNQYMQHDLVLAYGLINWVTRGLFLGQYHVYATQSIDDFFINDAEWIPGTACTNPITHDRTAGDDPSLPNFRLTSDDMTALVNWQKSKQADPLLKNFELSIAFNGVGTAGNSDWTGITGTDTLVSNLANYQQYFHWMSHTYDHPNTLDGLCKSTPTGSGCGDPDNPAVDSIDLEVLTNLWVASQTTAATGIQGIANLDTDESDTGLKQLIFSDYDPHSMVTPGVTGLDDPNVSLYLYQDGVFNVVTDTSVTTTATNNNGPNPSPNVGIVNGYAPGIYEVPRHPNDVFFNAANWADDDAEFICIYGPQGTNQAPFNTFTPAQILDFTSTTFVNNMLMGDMDPEMFHQPNLHFSDNAANLGLSGTHVSSLISDTYDQTFSKYEALYNLPVLTPTQTQMAAAMAQRNTYNLSGVTATWTGGADPSISITVPANTVPSAMISVTGLNSQGAESYGGHYISHIQVNAGQTVSLPAE